MRKLVLVKHALPVINPTIPAAEWTLADAGRARCVPLAAALAPFVPGVIVASKEPKATETGRLIAQNLNRPFETAPNLHEHDRRNEPFSDAAAFKAKVRSFFAQPDKLVMGRETADAAHRRFKMAVESVCDHHPAGTIVIVAHGTVISLLVARANELTPYPLWERLGLPAFVALEWPGYRLLEVVAKIVTDEREGQ